VPVAAVLLAAGASSRFGSQKLVQKIGGEPILQRVARAFCEAGASPVVVVLGNDGELLRKVIADLPVRVTVNDRWAEGMFTSVRAGLAAATEAAVHAVVSRDRQPTAPGLVAISPADLPFLRKDSLRTLFEAAASSDDRTLVVAAHAGRRGHPLVIPASLVGRILSWPDSAKLSDLIRQPDLAVREVDVGDEGVLRDVDVPADLKNADSGSKP